MLKFRSMRPDAERLTGVVVASKDDPRITKVGKFLRKTRLDELPQFLNVLLGEMSIVGPRPERPELAEQLAMAIPYFEERMRDVKPGITGLAQINLGYTGKPYPDSQLAKFEQRPDQSVQGRGGRGRPGRRHAHEAALRPGLQRGDGRAAHVPAARAVDPVRRRPS